jgi:hypothetical protein
MGISVVRPGWGIANLSRRAGQTQAPANHLPRKILYRGVLWTLLACMTSGAILANARFASAQEDRPHFNPGERKVPRKKDAGPRALAVLQMSANGKVSLVPVAILVNGKFWDASAYKANPVPMALEPGIVYEGERTGSSVGLFTINSALHSNAVNAQVPWIATGSWLAEGKEAPNKAMKAEGAPVGINSGDEPPRLTKGGSSSEAKPASDKPAANGAPASTSSPSSSSPSSSSPSSAPSGDEPPRLTRPASSSGSGNSGSSQPNSGQSGSGQSGSGQASTQSAPSSSPPAPPSDGKPADTKSSDNKPSDNKSDDKSSDKQAQTTSDKPAAPRPPESDSGAGEGNRPRLRRGKPTTSFADEDIPGYSRPGKTPSPGAKAAASAQEVVDLVPAISDAGSNELHAFNFVWLKEEEGERRTQITGIAKQELVGYLSAQAKATTTPAASGAKAGAKSAHTATKKIPEPILENVRMVAYDLWGNSTPVIVFSADAHLPPPAAGTPQSGVDTGMQYSIMLVLRPDLYDTLHKLYAGVTDRFHLDRTPRLQLIDAVDADGDGRGELLFKEVSDAGTGWILYRANADKLWKLFDSLSPE